MATSGSRNLLAFMLVLLALLFTSLVVPGPTFGSVQRQPTINIFMTDNLFQPQNLSINAGSTVVWTNNGVNPHTATSDTAVWDSGAVTSSQTYSRTFDTPGVFPYNCVFHLALGMVGTLTVLGTQPTATATPTRTPATTTPTAVTGTATPSRTPATATPTPLPPTATRVGPTPTAVQTVTAPIQILSPTPASTAAAPATPPVVIIPPPAALTPRAAVPTPAVLTGTGGSASDWLPLTLALAGLAIVVGLAVSLLARR